VSWSILYTPDLLQPSEPATGLDWDGTAVDGETERAIIFSSPPSAYPMTYIWKVYQRNQIGTTDRYYTNFFHGNDGVFMWDAQDYGDSYYGAHPYPEGVGNPGTRNGTESGKWEISVDANDFTELDNSTAPYPTYDQWYSQALRVQSTGGNNSEQKYWVALPSTANNATITHNSSTARAVPPSPCIIWGQTPNNGSNRSWGGYTRYEEQNARIRGVQIYTSALTEAQIVALSALETNAAVLAYCAANSISSLWYLNMNWKTSDISDKSGNGHNPSWRGTGRPVDWALSPQTSYSTSFGSAETPISESGAWARRTPEGGASVHTGWHDVITTSGHAQARYNAGSTYGEDYDDSYAYLTGAWAPDLVAEATVYVGGGKKEVELLFRVNDSGSGVRCYECLFDLDSGAAEIVRWNGPPDGFDSLATFTANNPSSWSNGDKLKASIVGQTISMWFALAATPTTWVSLGSHEDTTAKKLISGAPGIGFFARSGESSTDYGLSDYTVSAA
jgi:hypothetical protein